MLWSVVISSIIRSKLVMIFLWSAERGEISSRQQGNTRPVSSSWEKDTLMWRLLCQGAGGEIIMIRSRCRSVDLSLHTDKDCQPVISSFKARSVDLLLDTNRVRPRPWHDSFLHSLKKYFKWGAAFSAIVISIKYQLIIVNFKFWFFLSFTHQIS